MFYNFEEKRKEYINKTLNDLLGSVTYIPITPISAAPEQIETREYLKHITPVSLGPINGTPTKYAMGPDGRYIEKYVFKNEMKIGTDVDCTKKIYSIINLILKDKNIRSTISEEFVFTAIFEWIVDSILTPIENRITDVSDYLLISFNRNRLRYNIYIPIKSLDIDQPPLILGCTTFLYLTKDYIAKIALDVEEDKRENYIRSMESNLGKLYAKCSVNTEESKAKEIATDQVSLSLDVIKILSPTIQHPSYPIHFSLDYKTTHQSVRNILIQKYETPSDFVIYTKRLHMPFVITRIELQKMIEFGLPAFHDFLIKTLTSQSELEGLILNAIKHFASAISLHDLHERVAKIFTVLESLLLGNENAPILDSLTRYLPKIVSQVVETRLDVIKTIKDLYDVRSGLVHHAKKKDFELSDLAYLQLCTRVLILKLIAASASKTKKSEVLKEIDDKIMQA